MTLTQHTLLFSALPTQDELRLFRDMLEHVPVGVALFDPDLRLLAINHLTVTMLELPLSLFTGQMPTLEELLYFNACRGEYGPGDPHELTRQRMDLARKREAHRFVRERPNGAILEVIGAPLPGGGFVSIYNDITENKAGELALAEKNALLQTLADNLPCGVSVFDKDLQLVLMNDEAIRLLGFTRTLVDQRPHFSALARFNAERGEYGTVDVERFVADLTAKALNPTHHKMERVRPNGVVIDLVGAPIPHGGFVTTYSDVTEQRQAAQAIERLAHHDTLTGLVNRYALEARLDQLVADARRHGRRLAVLFLDMDNFKGINDSLGHGVGDEFLRITAQRLRETVRENDIVARLGGDEFVVVLPEVHQPEHALRVASKLLDRLSQPIELSEHKLNVSTSIGICFYPQDGQDRGSLMQSADIAMYQAKSMGKGVYRCFDTSMMEVAARRANLERALKQAVAQQAFAVHYQPLLDGRSGQVLGLEALIRWERSDGQWVAPLDFIPLAEELGLINQIGEWVLHTACAALAAWHQQGLSHLTLSVNLSAVQLRNPQLPALIAQVLQTHALPAGALTLEVTESVAMQDPLASVQRLAQIRALGVRLALDDFGTGYSSLAYLQRLPLDYLKLDRTFVCDLETNPNDAAICTATIGLAHHLGLAVVAEGVETPGQHDFLKGLGCDMCQGYLFSRPLSHGAVTQWLLDAADPEPSGH